MKQYKILLNIMNADGEYALSEKDEAKLIEVMQMKVGEFPAAQMENAGTGTVLIDEKQVKQYVYWLLNLIFDFDSVESADVRVTIPDKNGSGYSRGYDRFDHQPTFNVAGRIADARWQLEK